MVVLGGHDPVSSWLVVVAAHVVCGGCVIFVSILFVGAHDTVVLNPDWMMAMGPAVASHVARDPHFMSAVKTVAFTAITAATTTGIPTYAVVFLVSK